MNKDIEIVEKHLEMQKNIARACGLPEDRQKPTMDLINALQHAVDTLKADQAKAELPKKRECNHHREKGGTGQSCNCFEVNIENRIIDQCTLAYAKMQQEKDKEIEELKTLNETYRKALVNNDSVHFETTNGLEQQISDLQQELDELNQWKEWQGIPDLQAKIKELEEENKKLKEIVARVDEALLILEEIKLRL